MIPRIVTTPTDSPTAPHNLKSVCVPICSFSNFSICSFSNFSPPPTWLCRTCVTVSISRKTASPAIAWRPRTNASTAVPFAKNPSTDAVMRSFVHFTIFGCLATWCSVTTLRTSIRRDGLPLSPKASRLPSPTTCWLMVMLKKDTSETCPSESFATVYPRRTSSSVLNASISPSERKRDNPNRRNRKDLGGTTYFSIREGREDGLDLIELCVRTGKER
mmetsp:Transcript_42671/g.83892  ORF Transcript_42671/g.83892 Transcript_42671/m.83892 type:complete len:218 (+) Transcript_42671:1171-1824(+)